MLTGRLPRAGMAVAAVGGTGSICGLIMVVGSFMTNTDDRSRVRTGSMFVRVFTIV